MALIQGQLNPMQKVRIGKVTLNIAVGKSGEALEKASKVLEGLLQAKGNSVKASSFDQLGNVSFGLREHIDIPGMKYDPEIGIFGMDVSVSLEKAGMRVQRRRRAASSVHKKQRVSRDEAIDFFRTVLGIEVV